MKKAAYATPNKCLAEERLKRNWMQKDVATLIGTTPINISRWEGGITLPNAHFRYQLSQLFGKSEEELQLFVAGKQKYLQEDALNSIGAENKVKSTFTLFFPNWGICYQRNPLFTGRESVLQNLYSTFLAAPDGYRIQALYGLGGIGKTQIAVEYAYRYHNDYQTVLGIRAATEEMLLTDVLSIAQLLHLPEQDQSAPQKVFAAMRHWLNENSKWLLIIDDIQNLDLLSNLLPSVINGHVILTTNTLVTGAIAQSLQLSGMPLDEGVLFLLRRCKQITLHTPLDKISSHSRKLAEGFVQMVDGHPLALDQAGAYIEETACSLEDYLTSYRDHTTVLLSTRGLLTMHHPTSAATTIALAIEQAKKDHPATIDILRLCACLPNSSIPEEMLMQASSKNPFSQNLPSFDLLTFNNAIKELRRYSLISRDSFTKIISIPCLVKTVVHDLLV